MICFYFLNFKKNTMVIKYTTHFLSAYFKPFKNTKKKLIVFWTTTLMHLYRSKIFQNKVIFYLPTIINSQN